VKLNLRGEKMEITTQYLGEVQATLGRQEALLEELRALVKALVAREPVLPEWMTTAQAAQVLGLSDWTIRDHLRLGRLIGRKQQSGRGAYPSWVISADELRRYRREGLLPLCPERNRRNRTS
jgi:hypothetical protein